MGIQRAIRTRPSKRHPKLLQLFGERCRFCSKVVFGRGLNLHGASLQVGPKDRHRFAIGFNSQKMRGRLRNVSYDDYGACFQARHDGMLVAAIKLHTGSSHVRRNTPGFMLFPGPTIGGRVWCSGAAPEVYSPLPHTIQV